MKDFKQHRNYCKMGPGKDLGNGCRSYPIKFDYTREAASGIPKEAWDLDKQWKVLGERVSRLQNKFMGGLGEGDEGIIEFGMAAGELITEFRHLRDDSLAYMREYNAD